LKKSDKKSGKKAGKKSRKDSSSEELDNEESDSKKEKSKRHERKGSNGGRRKTLLPEKYDGTMPLTVFFAQFISCAKYNIWSKKDQATHLGVCLKGNA